MTPGIEDMEDSGILNSGEEIFEDDKDVDDDDEDEDDEKDLETSDETDDPSKAASTEKRKRKLRLAKLKKKSKKRAYEFSGGSDVVGIVFLDIGKITDLPPERNSKFIIPQRQYLVLILISNKDVIRYGSIRRSIFRSENLPNPRC